LRGHRGANYGAEVLRQAAAAVATSALALVLAGTAGAAVIHPDRTADNFAMGDAHCSLREAVEAANTNAPFGTCTAGDPDGTATDTIVLDAAPYSLDQGSGADSDAVGDLDVTGALIIQGQGPAATTIQAPETNGTAGDRVIEVGPAVPSFTLEGVKITGGRSGGAGFHANAGGGLATGGATDLTLHNCAFDDNRAGNGPSDGALGAPGGAVAAFSSGPITIDGCTFTNNHSGDGAAGAAGSGHEGGHGGDGGVLVIGGPQRLTITGSTFTGNSAGDGGLGSDANGNPGSSGGDGGAGGSGGVIGVSSGLAQGATISDSLFSGNHAGAGAAGGSLQSPTGGHGGAGGAGGRGGAVSLFASAVLTHSRFADDHAGAGGAGGTGAPSPSNRGTGGPGGDGGAFWRQGGQLTIADSSFAGNSAGDGSAALAPAGGALSNPGAGGSGGGIHTNGVVSVAGTTVSGNSAGDGGDGAPNGNPAQGGSGGGLLTGDITSLTNSTLSGNSAGDGGDRSGFPFPGGPAGEGGAIFVPGTSQFTALHATIAGNIGGRVGASTGNPPRPLSEPIGGAIAVGAAPAGAAPRGSAVLTSSILADNGPFACDGPIAASGADSIGYDPVNPSCPGRYADPLLAPLADNGGPAFTQALPANSPALDIGEAAGCPATDERGIGRPQGSGCDAGAFEREVTPPAGGAPPPPGGGGPPADTTPATLKLALGGQSLRSALANGYGVSFTTDEGGTAAVELSVAGGDAKGLKAARTVRVARGKKTFAAGGKKRVVAKFTKKARAKFKRRRRLTVRVRVSFTDRAGNKSKPKSKTVTIKR
jgi:hypothetical protein